MSGNPFQEVQDQIQWARMQIETGRKAFSQYVQADAFIPVTENNPDTGEEIKKVRLARPLPIDVKGHFRGAIVDLKHSFDMSLHAAARSVGRAGFDRNYPWANTPEGLKAILAKRQSKPNTNLPQVLIDEIWRQEPYGTGPEFSGGDDLAREIAHMANEKHTLGLVVVPSIAGYSITNISVYGTGGGALMIGAPWDPVKQELEISRVSPGSTVTYDDPTVVAEIFFKSTGSIGKVPAAAAALAFADRAQFVLEGFKTAVS